MSRIFEAKRCSHFIDSKSAWRNVDNEVAEVAVILLGFNRNWGREPGERAIEWREENKSLEIDEMHVTIQDSDCVKT